jgi:hypothetical protein
MTEEKQPKHRKFNVIIGNPPYQEESHGDQKLFTAPIYDKFMESAYKVGSIVELITPARFLFNAGSTPKKWNKKMLADPHLKVMDYYADSSKVFDNVDIAAGVAVTLRDSSKDFGAIQMFTPYNALNSTKNKVFADSSFKSLESIVSPRGPYRFTDKMHEDYPSAKNKLSKGHAYDLSSNVFDRLPDVFYVQKPNDGHDYIQILGREGSTRQYKYIRADYVKAYSNLHSYKVLIPKTNGVGKLGEVLINPIVGQPNIGHTETFLSIGDFSKANEANNALKYIKTKFARALLDVLKVTQDTTRAKWACVPLQDFTDKSDIDWTKSISEIDQQLYKKYNLSDDEIAFIEKNVKEMK